MGRAVFLSFLGTGKYEATRYFFDSKKENYYDTPFVQEAILKQILTNEQISVTPIIFLTKEASLNWESNDQNLGLKNALITANPKINPLSISILSGKTNDEIWNIFLAVFDQISDGDEVYFDITHGFRSLPLLSIVLLNYSKFLKNISVKGIYYGAFDAREIIQNRSWSPVWDLSLFSSLQDWTNAANQFLTTGNGMILAELMKGSKYGDLGHLMEQFSKDILVNRGPSIFEGSTTTAIKDQIKRLKSNEIDVIKIILSKVESHFNNYTNNSIQNGLNAVKWCIDNGLIQQGATLLEEFTTTFVLVKIGREDLIQDPNARSFVSSALSVAEENYRYIFLDPANKNVKDIEKYEKLSSIEKDIVPKVYSIDNYKALKSLVNDIKNSIRNDVNHAGFRENPKTYEGFKESLTKRYSQFLKII